MELQRLESTIRSQLKSTRQYVPAFAALDLIGAPRKEVARLLGEALDEKITTADLRDWHQGMPVPAHLVPVLRRLANWGVTIATDELIAVAKHDPSICLTISWRRFSKRIHEARELLRLRPEDAPVQ